MRNPCDILAALGEEVKEVSHAQRIHIGDPKGLSLADDEHSEDEERWITLGLDRTGAVLVVCHTFRDETESSVLIRLISARRANKAEIKQYGEN